MLFSVGTHILEIEDLAAMYCPLIAKMLETPVPVDRDDYGNITLNIDVDIDWLSDTYIVFLETGHIRIPNNTESVYLHIMGHSNTMKYPLNVWAMKLRDNWIRDHFYTRKLYLNPRYDLIRIPMKKELPVPIPKGWYVAGGAAMCALGLINEIKDIDMFTALGKREADSSMAFLHGGAIRPDEHVPDGSLYDAVVSGYAVSYTEWLPPEYKGYKMQMILRRYKCLSETLHGFDLDCVGVAYVPKGTYIGSGVYEDKDSMYLTRRAALSIKYKTNWMDPMRSSPSYIDRLIKYKRRGFNIFTPLLNESNIDNDAIVSYISTVRALYIDMEIEDSARQGIVGAIDDLESIAAWLPLYKMLGILMTIGSGYVPYDAYKLSPQSRLILAAHRNTYISMNDSRGLRMHPPSDYGDVRGVSSKGIMDFSISELQWKEQNPMEQLTSTIQPIPIEDISAWYAESPFYLQR